MPEIQSYIDRICPAADYRNLGNREIVVFSSRSPGKTTRNEDSIAWISWTGTLLIVLADGVGGQPGGGDASELSVRLMVDRFKNINDEQITMEVFREGILDAFERANGEIRDLAIGSGSTLTAVAIVGDSVRVFNVGDSSSVICGGRGKMKFSNTPHSPTGYAVAAGLLNEDDALHHDERHLISNIVGSPDMHIDIGPVIKLDKLDRLVVASDGLWDNMYLDEVIDAVRVLPLSRAARLIIKTCSNRMSQDGDNWPGHADDLSFVVVRSITRRVKKSVAFQE
jgi:serine/threonine protein phosphatase PrpC